MSPELGQGNLVGRKEEPSDDFFYFTLDLDKPGEFSFEEFKDLVTTLEPWKENGVPRMKFIVFGNLMYIFDSYYTHGFALRVLREEILLKGGPQCAGKIKTNLNPPEGRRMIYDYSSSLEEMGLLNKRDSDTYKQIKLQVALGDHFEILD